MDYKNGKIYKLQINDGYFYIGSTATELRKRLSQHKTSSKHHPERKIYKHIGGSWDNVKIILIEAIECNNKDELRKKEDEHIQKEVKNELCLNFLRSFVTEEDAKKRKKGYQEINKEKIKEYTKEYEKINKEKIRERKKKYRETNKEKIKEQKKEYYKINKEKKKEYYEINKEEKKEYSKQRYETNRQDILEKKKEYYKKIKITPST